MGETLNHFSISKTAKKIIEHISDNIVTNYNVKVC